MTEPDPATNTVAQGPALPPVDLADAADAFSRARAEVAKIVVGQQAVIEQMLIAMLARGHCLLVGVPGLAKTLMAKTLAETLDMQFNRVQFTPDLMPSDITGTTVLEHDPETGRKEFRFLPGPVFTNVLLADEINRTPPKTQASLLEAMQERQVTFGGERRAVPDPFLVLATQNPLEQEGTYPLPEAQLDRFMFSIIVSYTTHAEENRIVVTTTQPRHVEVEKVLGADQILAIQELVRRVPVPPQIVRYSTALVRASRPEDDTAPDFIKRFVDCGAGPRAGQYLVLAAKSRAIMLGRNTAAIEDVRAAAVPVLRHRMITNFTALSENVTPEAIVEELLKAVPDDADTRAVVYQAPAVDDEPMVKLPTDADPVELIRQMKQITGRIRREVQQVIIGQQDVLDLVLIALLTRGHCLLVGVPGLAKTLLVRTIAGVLDLNFKRVQFTPDLMPSDITGTDVMETDEASQQRHFRFIPGPVFSNVLLADEINRTQPKTQAALLEAMQELSVTAGGTTYRLDPPFFVLATQNPLEQEGTYPLPEAQLDRFMFHIRLDYPGAEDEAVIVDRTTGAGARPPRKVIRAEDIRRLQDLVRRVPISQHVLTYATSLVRATRPETAGCPKIIEKYVHCGASPRAAQHLILGAKARAVMQGRVNVSIADVCGVAVPVLRHRVFTNFLADAEGITPISLVEQLLRSLPAPKIRQEKKLKAEMARRPAAAQPRAVPARPANREGHVTVRCPECGETAKVPPASVGRKGKCNKCGTVFQISE
jgi:MoxR-like ATPase